MVFTRRIVPIGMFCPGGQLYRRSFSWAEGRVLTGTWGCDRTGQPERGSDCITRSMVDGCVQFLVQHQRTSGQVSCRWATHFARNARGSVLSDGQRGLSTALCNLARREFGYRWRSFICHW